MTDRIPAAAQAPVTVRVLRRFAAPAERVFDAWLDPAMVGKWLFATDTGEMQYVALDARVGGAFSIVELRDGNDVEHTGEYKEITRPVRLVFTFLVKKYATEPTRVSIDIVPHGSNCELMLTHEGVWADQETRTRDGWNKILDNLVKALGVGVAYA